ncbi:MAG: SurA N-terminal domain-containing protein [Paracoccaceae bacterium]
MASQSKSISKYFVWILLGLLIIGLGGFGASGLSGTMRSVGSVGDRDISIDEYARALRQELAQTGQQFGQTLTFEQAQLFGLPQQTLSRLVLQKAIEVEADRLGLSVGDEAVLEQLVKVSAFRGSDGQFSREAYTFALENNRLSEAEFEDGIRQETTRNIVQAAVVTGNVMPSIFTEKMIDFLLETRSFTHVQLNEADLATPLQEATEAQLQAYYDENIERFTVPESKQLTIASLDLTQLSEKVTVSDEAVAAFYEKQNALYNQPERRIVERLVFSDAQSADAAAAALKNGTSDFDALLEQRGLTAADVSLGAIDQSFFGQGTGAAVFNADLNTAIGPFSDDLGAAIFRVTEVLPAQSAPLEDVADQLRQELALELAAKDVDGVSAQAEDLLAAGATLEDLALETDLVLSTLSYHAGVAEGLAADQAFRQAAFEVKSEDFPEIIRLDNGGLAALRLDETQAPRPQPLAEIREDAMKAWRVEALRKALLAQADDLKSQLEAKTMRIEEIGGILHQETGLNRQERPATTTANVIERAFELAPDAVDVFDDAGQITLILVTEIMAADRQSELAKDIMQEITAQLSDGLSQDLFEAYVGQIQARADVSLNQAALNAVHANFQ